MTTQSTMRILERQDHQKCVSQGMDFGEWADIITEIYWRCRYILVQRRIVDDAITAKAIKNNAVMKRISNQMLKNLNRAKQAMLSSIDDDIDTLDHSRCIAKGYNLNSPDETEVVGYYKCRQLLVLQRKPPAPAVTHAYEAAILPESKSDEYMEDIRRNVPVDKRLQEVSNAVRDYPLCIGLNIRSDDFRRCVDSQQEAKKCLANVKTLKSRKQLENKIYCQQQAFIQFPDNYYVASYRSSSEIQKEKERKNKAKRDLIIEYLEGGVLQPDKVEIKQEEDPQVLEDALYNKIKLLKLREQFIGKCNKLMQEKLPLYIKKVADDCEQIGIDWDR